MSVGLLVVRFQYGLYVVVHLSKYISLFHVNVCCVVSFYACCQRFAALRRRGFSPQMLMRRTKLSLTTNVSAEH